MSTDERGLSDRVRERVSPLVEYLHDEAAGGVVLLVAAIAALVWANSPGGDAYFDLWHTKLSLGIGDASLDLDLQHWVNDGLMALFFFVVGLEIKRELVAGELRDPRAAALPAVAAVAGVVFPALIYFGFTAGSDGAAAGRFPRRPTSPSRSGSSRCWAIASRPRCGCSCWRSRSSTTSWRSRSSRSSTRSRCRSGGWRRRSGSSG